MKLVSALLIVSMNAQAHAAPILTALQRYQTDGPLVSQPVSAQGPNGEKLTIAIEASSPDDHLTARNEAGVKVAETAVYKSTRTERVSVLEAHVNSKNELVVITALSQEGMSGGTRLYMNNLKTSHSVALSQVSQYPQLIAQTKHQDKDLVVIETDLGQGPNNVRPSLLRVVDESNGQSLLDVITESVYSAKFLKNAGGRLQLLTIAPRNLETIDVESGVRTKLLVNRSPEAIVSLITTKIGDLLQVVDGEVTTMHELQAVVNGDVAPLRRYNSKEVEVSYDGNYIIEQSKSKIRIRDLVTNKQIGKLIERDPQQPSGGRFGGNLRGWHGHVADLLITQKEKIIVIEQAEMPSSYMRGSMLTYFDLASGKILRTRRQREFDLSVQLMKDEQGRVIAIEKNMYGQDVDTLIIDLMKDLVLTTIKNASHQIFMQTSRSRIVMVHDEKKSRVCLAYVDSLKDETCINDTMITRDTIYGITASKARLVVPLDNGRGKQTFSVE